MTYDMVKFNRGQVWYIKWKNKTYSGHEQQKDRPWVVLSVAKYNKSSGMITAVPVTTRNRIESPAQVEFSNDRDVLNVILCEQIRSFDTESGSYEFQYMGSLSDEVLNKVDTALAIHLGLKYSPVTLDLLNSTIKSTVENIISLHKNDNKVFTEDDVINFAEKLQDLTVSSISDSSLDTSSKDSGKISDKPTVPITVVTAKKKRDPDTYDLMIDGRVLTEEDRQRELDEARRRREEKESRKRIKWDKKTCKEFLDDTINLPMIDVMKKWNISKKTRYYSMKNYAQIQLEKMIQD